MPKRMEGKRTNTEALFVRPTAGGGATEELVRYLLRAISGEEVDRSSAEVALKHFLSLLKELLAEGTPFPLEGEISHWMSQMPTLQLGGQHVTKPADFARYLERGLGALHSLDDPRKRDKVNQRLRRLSAQDRQQLEEAVKKGDFSAVHRVLTFSAEELGPDSKLDVVPGCSMARAAVATAWCLVLHKENPLSLIARARQGDRFAVLDLVKVDKLFLRDSCTEKVIREATMTNDPEFLRQLSKALKYKPKAKGTQLYRLLLYMLLAMGIDLSPAYKLQQLVDPEGTVFKGTEAFPKFLQRCRSDFKELQSTPGAVISG